MKYQIEYKSEIEKSNCTYIPSISGLSEAQQLRGSNKSRTKLMYDFKQRYMLE